MATERVSFTGARGGALSARLERPTGEPLAHVLFAHCFTCSKDLHAVRWISRTLQERGFAVLRFDFTGLGESEGEFADTNFSSNVEDLLAAAAYLRREHVAPELLIGHSLGGAAVLVAARRIAESRAVVTIGAPSETEHLRETLLRDAPELADTDEAEVELGGRPFRIRRQLLDDLAEAPVREAVSRLGRALLVLHAPSDETVAIEHAARIFDAARHPKSFVALDGADHLLNDERDARFVAEVTACWAARYVGGGRAATAVPGRPPEEGEVVIVGGPEGYATTVVSGRHVLRADEPVEVGGTDTGPTPYGYLLAALGACKAITARMYADRKGWPLRQVRNRLRHDRIHAEDCDTCETKEGKIDRITSELEFVGPLSDQQRARLFEIADRCPVHRTLKSEVDIQSSMAE